MTEGGRCQQRSGSDVAPSRHRHVGACRLMPPLNTELLGGAQHRLLTATTHCDHAYNHSSTVCPQIVPRRSGVTEKPVGELGTQCPKRTVEIQDDVHWVEVAGSDGKLKRRRLLRRKVCRRRGRPPVACGLDQLPRSAGSEQCEGRAASKAVHRRQVAGHALEPRHQLDDPRKSAPDRTEPRRTSQTDRQSIRLRRAG